MKTEQKYYTLKEIWEIRMNKEAEIKRYVEELKVGNQANFKHLYTMTFAGASAVAARYLKNRDDQMDVIQEAYIKALEKNNTLEKSESFASWLNQIVATRSLNMLRVNNPVYMEDLASDDQDGAAVEFEDESPAFRPDQITDIHATADAVEEIMNMLPEMQRAALWMHYGQEISVKDIAEAAGVSENTIKSRLKQGRDKLYKMKDEFKKRGIEITSIGVGVLLFTLFTGRQQAYADTLSQSPEFKQMHEKILGKINDYMGYRSAKTEPVGDKNTSDGARSNTVDSAAEAGSKTVGVKAAGSKITGSKTAGSKAAGTAGLSAVKIGIIALIAAGVAAAVIAAAVIAGGRNKQTQESAVIAQSAVEKTAEDEASAESVEEVVAESAAEEIPEKTPEEIQAEKDAEAIAQYKDILANLSSVENYTEYFEKSGYYMYTLVRMHEGEVPTLLLAQQTNNFMYYGRLYYYDTDADQMIIADTGFNESAGSDEVLIFFGVAPAGGMRAGLSLGPDGYGLRSQQFMSTSPDVDVIEYSRDNERITATKLGTYTMGTDSELAANQTIQWHSWNDNSALDMWPEISPATGEDGFPADQNFDVNYNPSYSTGGDNGSNGDAAAPASVSISGTYVNAEGRTRTIQENADGSITLDGTMPFPQNGEPYHYEEPTVTGSIYFVTDKTPIEMHIVGEFDVTYTKVD